MQTKRWNKKRLFIIGVILLGLYVIFSASYNKYEISAVIKNTKPEHVWEYVADFSKMRILNPTILDFKITSEHGHFDHWKYSVEYKEKLSHWPYWINVADANFAVKKIVAANGTIDYLVESDHKTCFFGGLYCLYSKGVFKINGHGADAHCVETVHYQCPPFMGSFCKSEVVYQRKAIMNNLTMQFTQK